VTAVWVTIGVLAVATAAIKAAGPVLLGGRELPPRMMAVIALLPAALLAALVVVETFSEPDGGFTIDARAAGLVAAGAAVAVKASIVIVIIVAAAAAALARALGAA
jgi:branched-subunit amino acid transport protein